MQAALRGLTALLVPGCGGGRSASERQDGAAGTGPDGGPPQDDGGKETAGEDGAACRPTCPVATRTVAFPFSDYPQLKNPGGSAVDGAPGYSDPSCHLDKIIVVQTSVGNYLAFSAACPHQCCPISFDAAHAEFVCPCHGSTFDIRGRVSNGPAPNGLQPLPACADECAVYVTIS